MKKWQKEGLKIIVPYLLNLIKDLFGGNDTKDLHRLAKKALENKDFDSYTKIQDKINRMR